MARRKGLPKSGTPATSKRTSPRFAKNSEPAAFTTPPVDPSAVAVASTAERPPKRLRYSSGTTRYDFRRSTAQARDERNMLQPFRFLDLPPELRNMVYDYIPWLSADGYGDEEIYPWMDLDISFLLPGAYRKLPSILFANKQLMREAGTLLFSGPWILSIDVSCSSVERFFAWLELIGPANRRALARDQWTDSYVSNLAFYHQVEDCVECGHGRKILREGWEDRWGPHGGEDFPPASWRLRDNASPATLSLHSPNFLSEWVINHDCSPAFHPASTPGSDCSNSPGYPEADDSSDDPPDRQKLASRCHSFVDRFIEAMSGVGDTKA